MSQTVLSFHNTISAKGAELDKLETRARSLEDLVLQMFYTTHKSVGIAKVDLIRKFGKQYGESSYGRALTNLVERGKIQKTQDSREGYYGDRNFIYKLIER